MICTSSYKEVHNKGLNTISISKDKGEDASYVGDVYLDLAPKRDFFKTWRNNRGIIPDEENNAYYMDEFYDKVLSVLDVEKVYNDLDGKILLCYEDNMDFCHRHIVAAWFELLLGFEIPEVKIVDNKMIFVERPKYIKDYLEKIMKEKKILIKK